MAILVASPAYSQSASISGRVIGRDGQPAQGIVLKIDSLTLNNGRLQIRESLEAKTGRNGEYSKSGLYNGRVMVSVIENGMVILTAGEKVGDEIFLADGLDKRIPTFDLTKAPAPAPAAAAAAANSGLSEAERKALRDKLEKEAAAAGEASKAFDAGKAAFTAKDFPESIRQFKLAAEKNPSQDVIWANLGRAYDANKEYDSAIEAYGKAITLKPVESNYYLNLSLAQISGGKIEESKASIEKAAALNPANAGQAYYNLGATLINRNKPDEALEPLKKSIELDPKFAPAHYQIGMTLVQKGKLDEAPQYFQKCLDLGASCPDATTAKALLDTLKAQAPTSFTSKEKQEADAKAKAEAEAKNKSKTPAKGKN
jgi:tetratricopeptide (TPR) repeat protein